MNRRSLLLGSLVAGAAGLFGVKAKEAPVEPDYESAGKAMAWLDKQHPGNVVPSGTLTLKDYQAAAELLRPSSWETIPATDLYLNGYDITINGKGYNLGSRDLEMAAQVEQIAAKLPEPVVLTERWARMNGWGSVLPTDLINTTHYFYSINPDLSDLMTDDDFDT